MDPLDNLEARVETFLGQLGAASAFRPGGVSVLDAEGTAVLVTCFAQHGGTWCRIAALVLLDVEPSLALLHRLLSLNHDVLVGGFQLFEDRTLAFSATVPGETLDTDVFQRVLGLVTTTAQRHAAELGELAGGTTWRGEAPAPS